MLISSIPSSSSGPSTSQQPRPIAMPNPASGSASEKSRAQSESTRNSPSPSSSPPIVLAIHGGAGGTITPDIPPELQAAYRARLRAALQAGYAVLQQRGGAGNALDAVCLAVKVLEDSPLFNAGKGAVFTREGTVECEASVMVSSPKKESNQGSSTSSGLPALMHSNDWFERGCPADEPLPRSITASSEKHADDPFTCNTSFSTSHIASTRRCAAATLVKGTKNPILLARTLFLSPEEAPHVLLSGQEAEKIGWEKGCVKVDQQYYWTLKRWREHRRGLGLSDDIDDENDGDSPPARLNDRETFPTDCKLPPKTEGPSFSLPSLPPSAHLTPPPSYSSAIREGAREQIASSRPPTVEAPESSSRSVFSESGSTRTTPPSSYYGRTPSLSIGSSSASTSGPSVDSTSTDEDNNEYSEPTHPDSSIFDQLSAHFDFNSLPQGTVGACAIDAEGRMAVATSTGGKTNKNSGRVGDTPSVGAGFWAERFDVTSGDKAGARVGEGQRDGEEAFTSSWRDLFCGCLSARSKHASQSSPEPAASGLALSGTGDGDYFLRVSFASLVAHRMRFLGEDSVTAGKKAIDELGKTGGVGGSIVLDHHGNVSFPMNSTTMNRGYISSLDGEKAKVALFPGEELS